MTKALPYGRAKRSIWHPWRFWLALLPATLLVVHCAPLDEGDAELARIRRLPDPVEFGARIHPTLISSCAAAQCHARDRTFRLHPVDPLPIDAQITHPLELPEALQADYYTVLSYCDLQIPESSHLIRWGTGAEPAHPGQNAMTVELEAALLAWLRSGGNP